MSIKLIKECTQTGEDWAIYEIEVPISGNIWVNGLELHCSICNNRILFDEPIDVSVH